MTPEEEEDIRFVGKLLEQTVTHAMTWQSLPSEYMAKAGGMEFHLEVSPSTDSRLWKMYGLRPDDIILRVCDPETKGERTFSDMPIVGDLYTIVRKELSRPGRESLGRKIKAFLKEDVTHV